MIQHVYKFYCPMQTYSNLFRNIWIYYVITQFLPRNHMAAHFLLKKYFQQNEREFSNTKLKLLVNYPQPFNPNPSFYATNDVKYEEKRQRGKSSHN